MLTTALAYPTFVLTPFAGGPPAGTYSPAQIVQAYGFNQIAFNGTAGTGKGETIAIVDAYDDSKIQSDLNTFDSQFGLPQTTVVRVNQTGGTSYPASRFVGRLGARGIARRGMGARDRASGDHHAGRG